MPSESKTIRFDGQAAIVTGAGGGIGRAIALELARRGAQVLVNDYGGDTFGRGASADRAETVAAEIRAAGGKALANSTAVGTHAAARAIVRAALDAFGRVDILANNAGITLPGLIDAFSDDEVDAHFSSNLLGAYAMVRTVWPHMRRQNYGRILNTSSSAALGIGANAPYATTKAGLIGLTLDAAAEGKPHGIHVNAMMPTAYSRMIEQIPDPAFVEWFRANLPAEKVGAGVAFYVSRECALSGRVLTIGGGRVGRIAFFGNRGHFDSSGTAESVRDHAAEIDDLTDSILLDSCAAESGLYTELFPFRGSGVPALDRDAVVGAGKREP